MKIPKRPPGFYTIYDKIKSDSSLFFRIISAVDGLLVHGKYLHWDKIRCYKTPDGLSHEQWWFGIKLKRRGLYKEISLADKDSHPFKFLDVDPMAKLLHSIDQCSSGTIGMSDKIVNPDTRNQYYLNSLIEEAITSSQLEGAATTRKIAKEMIRSGRRPSDRSERMILNNFQSMQQIVKLKKEPLTKDLILRIHHLVTDQTLDDNSTAGRIRTPSESVVVADMYDEVFHDPPLAHELDQRMQAMCDFANGKSPDYFIHPVVRSIILHFWLAYDHPFVDGNGRTARTLFYWSMLHYGYWLFEFISISQSMLKAPAQYARAFLYTETDENDLTYFIIYHLQVIQKAIDQLHDYIKRHNQKLRYIQQHMQEDITLNHRQRALISHALRHPLQRYTIKVHQVSHGVVYQTARTDLFDLEKRGLLKSIKIGRTYCFMPVKDLETRLSGS